MTQQVLTYLLRIISSFVLTTFHHLGNVYIADTFNHRIRKVTVSTGIITTIAGSSTSGSYSGDGGQATSATLFNPTDVALDSTGTSLLCNLSCCLCKTYFYYSFYLGNVYIADCINLRIRKVTISTGIITTFAGTGTISYSGDGGLASSAALNFPAGVALDSAGTH